ncbi:hypothetical protein LINPERPRIM_LOCUS37527 [Linum perenne]
MATTEGARARYARVCVKIDVSKPLLGKYMIEDRMVYVVYESLENICATCGFYGHKSDNCNPVPPPDSIPQKDTVVVSPTEPEAEGDAGEWMVVQRKGMGKPKKEVPIPSKSAPSGSGCEGEGQHKQPERPKSVAQQKLVDPITANLASQLADALSKAACMQIEKGAMVTPRQPLGNVFNVAHLNQKDDSVSNENIVEVEKEPGLINILVIYDNPTFLGAKDPSKPPKEKKHIPKRDKDFTKSGRSTVADKDAKKDGKQIRSFVTHPEITNAASCSDKGSKTVTATAAIAMKPPDKA